MAFFSWTIGCWLAIGLPLTAQAEEPPAEIVGGVGFGGGSSSWAADPNGFAALRVGYRIEDFFSVTFAGRLGYAPIDERLLTSLLLGVELWGRWGALRPHALLAAAHNHEEPQQAFRANPIGAAFGVGDGIRHRAGAHAGLGLDIALQSHGDGQVYLSVESGVTWFPDDRGPPLYVGGLLLIAFDYAI